MRTPLRFFSYHRMRRICWCYLLSLSIHICFYPSLMTLRSLFIGKTSCNSIFLWALSAFMNIIFYHKLCIARLKKFIFFIKLKCNTIFISKILLDTSVAIFIMAKSFFPSLKIFHLSSDIIVTDSQSINLLQKFIISFLFIEI